MVQHQSTSTQSLLANCIEFLKDLKPANDANSFGVAVIEAFKETIYNSKPDSANSHEAKLDEVFSKHARFLQTSGLEVYYAGEVGGEARIRINDPVKFDNFFNKLPDITFTAEHKTALLPLIENLYFQFDELCLADNLSEEQHDILASFKKIAVTCEDLDYSNDANLFSSGLELHKLGLYKASKALSRINLVVNEPTTNPSDWHNELTVEAYETYWTRLLADLKEISSEHSFSEPFRDFWEKIVAQANEARSDMNRNLSLTDRDKMLGVLERAFETLTALKPQESED